MQKYLFTLVLFTVPLFLSAQFSNVFSSDNTRTLDKVTLYKADHSFPESYLKQVNKDSMVLLTDVSTWLEPPLYARTKLHTKDYDYMVISPYKDRLRNSLIWGAILGSVSYYFSREISRTKANDVSITQRITRQPGHDGVIPGIIGGVTGFGIGIIIGQHISKKKVKL
ncbi:MAG: hypothetical protein AAF849_19895 [Bacteroidota bacterium]